MAMTLQEQLRKAEIDLSNAKTLRQRALDDTKGNRYEKFDPTTPKGAKAEETLRQAVNNLKAKQAVVDNFKNAIALEKEKKAATNEEEGVAESTLAANAGMTIEEYRADKQKKLDAVDQKNNSKKGGVDTSSIGKDIEVAGSYIANLGDPGRKDLANQLNKVYGLNLPLNGKYSEDLKTAYLKALSDNYVRSLDFNRNIPFSEFLVIAENEGTYKAAGGAGGPELFGSISNETEARALINAAFKAELGRDATAQEVAKLSKELNAAEKKNPFKTTNGIRTGGLNKEQFLKDQIIKLPEFSQKKAEKTNLTSQSITGLAKANGLNLSQDQINNFTQQIENGTDIKTVQNQIRSIAGNGMPDSVKKLLNDGVNLDVIYSPYKSAMASVLEINPESIDLNDSTLRSAVGPDKEMPIYEFERNLRKDSRWQYTNNAREEAYAAVNKILQDFGFRG
jgi:hypothetical protein